MIIGELDYQRAFFKNALYKTGLQASDLAADLFIHKNTLRKWVNGEQAAPAIAFSAVCMYLKLKDLNQKFSLSEAPEYKLLKKENIKIATNTNEFKKFISTMNNELKDFLGNELDYEDVYFLYSCMHDKKRIDELCLAIKLELKKFDEIKNKNHAKMSGTRLIKQYIKQYPTESLPAIKSAFDEGLIDKNVLQVAINQRLEFIDIKYNLWLADLKSRVAFIERSDISELISFFDYKSKNFSPDKFIKLKEVVESKYIELNGGSSISSTKAFALHANIMLNFDFL